jgi:hypothetical protein
MLNSMTSNRPITIRRAIFLPILFNERAFRVSGARIGGHRVPGNRGYFKADAMFYLGLIR